MARKTAVKPSDIQETRDRRDQYIYAQWISRPEGMSKRKLALKVGFPEATVRKAIRQVESARNSAGDEPAAGA